MALKRITKPPSFMPRVVSNNNRERPKALKKPTSMGKIRAKGKSVAEQIADNFKAKSVVLSRTLRGVRKV